jgi:hypothetical protein
MARNRLLLLLLSLLPACTFWQSEGHVLITSEPAGARIAIDGKATSYTTPAYVPLGQNFCGDHRVTVALRGHRPATGRLYQHTDVYTSKWIDGAFSMDLWPLPFFWTTGDVLLPFGVRGALVPHELHFRLQPDDAPLLGFDLLATKAGSRPQ